MERDYKRNDGLDIEFSEPNLLYQFVTEKIALFGDSIDTDAQEQVVLLNFLSPQILPDEEVLQFHAQYRYKNPEWDFELEDGAVLSIKATLDSTYDESGAKVQLRSLLTLDWTFMEEDREAQLANDPTSLLMAFAKAGYDCYAYQPFLPPRGKEFVVTDQETGTGYETIRSITTGDITEIVVSNASQTIAARLYLNTNLGEREGPWDENDRGDIHFWATLSEEASKFYQGLEDYKKILSILLHEFSDVGGFEKPQGQIVFSSNK